MQIKPTFTANEIGYDQVENGYVNLNDCTDTDNPENCERQAGGDVIINPIRSARLNTLNSFNFKYGRVEIIAKTPRGDWLWPGDEGNEVYIFKMVSHSFSHRHYSKF